MGLSALSGLSGLSGICGGASPLLDRLVSHWSKEAASGPRLDDFGGNTLTDNNTVTQAAGKVGNAAQFTAANSEYLSIADNPALSMGDIDFTVGAWVYLDSIPGTHTLLGKWSDQANQRGYRVDANSAGTYTFYVSSNGTNFPGVTISGAVTAAWHFLVAWHDSVANTINIQLNNGTPTSAAHTTGVFDNTASFEIGTTRNGAGGVANLLTGRVDQAFVTKRLLTAAERSFLYNAGAGRSWADILAYRG